jgi:type III secretion protein J
MNHTKAPARRIAWLAWALVLTGCETAVAGGLSETQANEMLVALQQEGVGALKEPDEGARNERVWRVTVPSDDAARALQVLRANNLPRAAAPGLHEVFGDGSLVPTPTEERGRYAAALAGELSRSIETIDGVLGARVHVAIPDARSFSLDESPRAPRASVLVRHRGQEAPFDQGAIQALVAGAVDGLEGEQVSVVSVATQVESREAPPLAKVGPVWVAQGSARLLRGIFAAAAISGMLVAAGLGLLTLRHQRARRAGPPAPVAPAD